MIWSAPTSWCGSASNNDVRDRKNPNTARPTRDSDSRRGHRHSHICRIGPVPSIGILKEEHCQLVAGNDAMFLRILSSAEDARGLCVRGGQVAAGAEVQRRLHDELNIPQLCCSYALSESSPTVAFARWNDPFEERVAGLMWPLPGVTIRIRDPHHHTPRAAGDAGEILVKGPSVMKGDYQQSEATAQAFDAEGWLITGDLGVLASDGRLRFLGRLKNIIRVGGENFSPIKVDNLLLTHPSIAAAQAVSIPDARLSEVPVAYIACNNGIDCTEQELQAASHTTLN